MLCLSSDLTLGKSLSRGVGSDRSVSMKGVIHRTQGATLSHVRPDGDTDELGLFGSRPEIIYFNLIKRNAEKTKKQIKSLKIHLLD